MSPGWFGSMDMALLLYARGSAIASAVGLSPTRPTRSVP